MLSQFKQNAAAAAEIGDRGPQQSSAPNKRQRVASPPPETTLPTVPVRTIYIVCPPRQQSGGPEAMHQLCDRLNTHPTINNVFMLYIQEHKNSASKVITSANHYQSPLATPTTYSSLYNCPVAPSLPMNISTELIIYPECWTHLIDSFPQAQIAIWWLSVDNNHSQFQQFHRKDVLHLYQSHYAKHYLLSHMTPPENILEMTEYIAPSRIPPVGAVDSGFRDLDVLYNPAKGVHYTDAIRSRSEEGYKLQKGGMNNSSRSSHDGGTSSTTISSKMRFRPIGEGLGGRKRISPEEVTSLLLRSKVYIDFGPHPGMDRLPREAALCGCIIVTNGEGSAGFPKDYPIPEEYRIRTFDVDTVHKILRKSIDEFEERRGSFEDYREWIMGQFDRMEECVKVFLDKVVEERRISSEIVTGIALDGVRGSTHGKDIEDEDEVRSYGNAKKGDDSSLGSGNDDTGIF